jgi:hypothetical protein
MDLIGNYKINPEYGKGVFRRRIRLERHINHVHGALEDSHHGFQVRVFFEDNRVTEIKPQFMRVPFTSCDSADQPLRNLLGAAIDSNMTELVAIAQPLNNCTHLLDLTLLTIAHTQRPETVVQYDVAITDAMDGISQLKVWRNNKLIHDWQSQQAMQLSAPAELAGKPLFMGFSRWANEVFDGIDNEAAFVLQKGNLVSIGRMINVDAMAGGRAIDEHERHACHTYSPGQSATAIRLANTTRDFTDCAEQLLTFR